MAAVILKDISLRLPVYTHVERSIRRTIFSARAGGELFFQNDKSFVEALSDVELTLGDGDRLGLKGHNGAGKSSLLRVMAGIYKQTSGHLEVNGSTGTLLDLATGLDDELSGLENVIRLMLMKGLSYRIAKTLVRDVQDFAQIGEFFFLPIRTYSSGMRARLLFGAATAIKPEILLIDEMFGVGDADFQKRSQDRLAEIMEATKIVVLASHNDDIISKFCNKVALFDKGRLISLDTL